MLVERRKRREIGVGLSRYHHVRVESSPIVADLSCGNSTIRHVIGVAHTDGAPDPTLNGSSSTHCGAVPRRAVSSAGESFAE